MTEILAVFVAISIVFYGFVFMVMPSHTIFYRLMGGFLVVLMSASAIMVAEVFIIAPLGKLF